jgi:hypothetical protein
VAPGERFSVDVQVDAGRPVSHLPLAIRYDPTQLELEAWARGDFLGGPGQSELLGRILAPGELLVGASRLAGFAGAVGSGRLLRLRFRALAEGAAEVSFESVRALGPGLVDRRVETSSATVTVAERADEPADPGVPGPEPPDGPDLPEVL